MSMHYFYHVTHMDNVPSIREKGLIPQIGARSKDFGEPHPGVFLFSSEEEMNYALSNWLGEWYNDHYGENCNLAILKIRLSPEIQVFNSEVEYEKICKDVILPDYISFYDEYGKELSNTGRVKIPASYPLRLAYVEGVRFG